jgi:hypothetical protein
VEFHFEFDSDHLVRKLDALSERLDHLSQAANDELYNWEAEDLRRKTPWVRSRSKNRFYTSIRPHSGKTIRSRARRRRLRRELYSAFKVRLHRRVRRPSIRPLLRPELFDQLVERMNALLQRTIRWE